jgi:hypothetical protein
MRTISPLTAKILDLPRSDQIEIEKFRIFLSLTSQLKAVKSKEEKQIIREQMVKRVGLKRLGFDPRKPIAQK